MGTFADYYNKRIKEASATADGKLPTRIPSQTGRVTNPSKASSLTTVTNRAHKSQEKTSAALTRASTTKPTAMTNGFSPITPATPLAFSFGKVGTTPEQQKTIAKKIEDHQASSAAAANAIMGKVPLPAGAENKIRTAQSEEAVERNSFGNPASWYADNYERARRKKIEFDTTKGRANHQGAAIERQKIEEDYYKAKAQYEAHKDDLGMYGKGNVDLYHRPVYKNEDGSISTVESMTFSFTGKDGKTQYVLLPSVWEKDGKAYKASNSDEVLKHYDETGEFLGVFDSDKNAEDYAIQLHKAQEKYYTPKSLEEIQSKIAAKRKEQQNVKGDRVQYAILQDDIDTLQNEYTVAWMNEKAEDAADEYPEFAKDLDMYITFTRTADYNSGALKKRAEKEAKALEAKFAKYGISGDILEQYALYMDRRRNEEDMAKELARAEAGAKESPVGASALSVLSNLGGGLGFIDAAIQKSRLRSIDPNLSVDYNTAAMMPSKVTSTIRETVANDIESPVLSFMYQTGMSMMDSAVIMAIGAGTGSLVGGFASTASGAATAANVAAKVITTPLFAGNAATSAMLAAKERGASDTQALLTGLAQGVSEALFEEISMDKFFNNFLSTPVTFKNLIPKLALQGVIEGSEEINTTLANSFTDALIMRGKSEYNTSIQRYMSEGGLSYKEAKAAADKDWWTSLAQDGLGGFISGFFFGLGGAALNSMGVRYVSGAKEFGLSRTDGSRRLANNLIHLGGTSELETSARELGTQARAKLDRGENLTDEEIGTLYAANQMVSGYKIAQGMDAKEAAVYAENGVSSAASDRVKQMVTQRVEAANKGETSTLTAAQQIYKEAFPEMSTKKIDEKIAIIQQLIRGELADPSTPEGQKTRIQINKLSIDDKAARAVFTELTGVVFPEGKIDKNTLYNLYYSAHTVAEQASHHHANEFIDGLHNALVEAQQAETASQAQADEVVEPTVEAEAPMANVEQTEEQTTAQTQTLDEAQATGYNKNTITLSNGVVMSAEDVIAFAKERLGYDEEKATQFYYASMGIASLGEVNATDKAMIEYMEGKKNESQGRRSPVSDDHEGRNRNQRAGEPTGSIRGSAEESDSVDAGRGSGTRRTSSQLPSQHVLPLENGREVTTRDESEYDDAGREAKQKFAAIGVSYYETDDQLTTATGKGAGGVSVLGKYSVISTVKGFFTKAQTRGHEFLHQLFHAEGGVENSKTAQALKEAIIKVLGSEEKFDALVKKYVKLYDGVYAEKYSKLTPEQAEIAQFNDALEELLCDAYGQMNRGKLGADALHDVVTPIVDAALAERGYQAQSATETEQTSNTGEATGGAKYSIIEIVGEKQNYGQGVLLDTDIFDNVPESQWGTVLGNYVYDHLAGTQFVVYDEQGKPEPIYVAHANERVKKDGAKNSHRVLGELEGYRGQKVRAKAIVHLSELLKTSVFERANNEHNHQWLDEHGWITRVTYLQTPKGNIYRAELKIADGRDRKIVYAVNKPKLVDYAKNLGEHTVTDNSQRFRYQKPKTGRTQSEAENNIHKQIGFVKSQEQETEKASINEPMRVSFHEALENGDKETVDKLYMEAVKANDEETLREMVDAAANAAGYTIKAYHGTPNGTYNIFRDWSYFTENKDYADIYQNQGASSNGYKKTADYPKTYSVYLDPHNVFDTRTARDRTIFKDEFYQKWGNGAPLSDRGLLDWTDGDDIIEFFEEKGYDYDAFYLDEGGTGGYGDDVKDRGISVVVKNSAQVKSADLVTYDDSGNVIPLSERFNPKKKDIRYSLDAVEPVTPTSDEWKRSKTTEEAQAAFPNMWNVAADESETRNPTQIASTVGTYRKIFDILKNENFSGTILDASSGLGFGTEVGKSEYGFDVEDIEPFPGDGYTPKYTDYSKLNKKYDVIISSAVLNVLPQDLRDALVVKMGSMLKDGGRIFVTTRGRDVETLAKTGKNIRLGNLEWIETVKGSYQKGFTNRELAAYLQDALGDGFTVSTASKETGGRFNNNTSVVVTKKGAGATELNETTTPDTAVERHIAETYKQQAPTAKYSILTEDKALPKEIRSATKNGTRRLLTDADLQKGGMFEGLTAERVGGLVPNQTVPGVTVKALREFWMRKNGFSTAQVKNVSTFLSEMTDLMKRAGVKYTFLGVDDINMQRLQFTYDTKGRIESIVLSAMVKNGEYPVNFDLSSICKKRVAMSKFIEALTKNGYTNQTNFKLTPGTLFAVNEAIRDAGYETACLGCFVESKRYNMEKWASSFCEIYNAAVRAINPQATDFGFSNGNASESSIEKIIAFDSAAKEYAKAHEKSKRQHAIIKAQADLNKGEPIVKGATVTENGKKIKNTFAKTVRDRIYASTTLTDAQKAKYLTCDVTNPKEFSIEDLKVLVNNGILPGVKTDKETSIRDLVASGEAYQHLIHPSDLMTKEGIAAIKALPALYNVVQDHYGNATPKMIQGFTPYNSEIATLQNKGKDADGLAKYLYSIAGTRLQSFSDFQVQNVYDYLQIVGDLAARKLPAHAYTKELLFAKVFGLTGMKINLSVMFDIDVNTDKEHAGLTLYDPKVHTGEYARIVLSDEWGDWVYNIGDRTMQLAYENSYPNNGRRFIQSIGFADAVRLQQTEGYTKNCGIVGVGYSRGNILAMLDDERIRYIIPYHASSLPSFIKEATNIHLATDHTAWQNTTKIQSITKDKKSVQWDYAKRVKQVGAIEALNELNRHIQEDGWVVETKKVAEGHGNYALYENLAQTKDPRATARNYIQWCAEQNYLPLFYEYAGHENYYKLVYDFNVYDNVDPTKYAPQTAVENVYPSFAEDGTVTPMDVSKVDVSKNSAGLESLAAFLDGKMDVQNRMYENLENAMQQIADDVKNGVISAPVDEEYLELADTPDKNNAKLQEMVDAAAAQAGYNIKVYHGTANGGHFNFFDVKKLSNSSRLSQIGQGFYFTNDKAAAQEYTRNTDVYGNVSRGKAPHLFEGYLRLTQPIEVSESSRNISEADIRSIISEGNYTWFLKEGIAHDLQNIEIDGKRYTKEEISRMSTDEKLDLYAEHLSSQGDKFALQNMVRAYPFDSQDRLLSSMAKHLKADGIVWDMGDGRVQYVAFSSNQFKESAPVTYDDNGDVIPLSKRFNNESPDIRYSVDNPTEADMQRDETVQAADKMIERLLHDDSFIAAVNEAYDSNDQELLKRQAKNTADEQAEKKQAKTAAETLKAAKAEQNLAWIMYYKERLRAANRTQKERTEAVAAKYRAREKGIKQTNAEIRRAELAIARDEKAKALADKDLAWRIYHAAATREASRDAAADKRQAVKAERAKAAEDAKVQHEIAQAEKQVQHDGDTMGLRRKAAEAIRKAQERVEGQRQRLQNQKIASRKAGKTAVRDRIAVREKRAQVEAENGPIDTLRKNPKEMSRIEKIKAAANKLRTVGRSLYKAFTSDIEALERFDLRQKTDGIRACDYAKAAQSAGFTINSIYKDGLTDKAGDRIGESMASVFLCTDRHGKVVESEQALLQDYLLHKHNIDRMSIEARMLEKLENFERENPWVTELTLEEFKRLINLSESEVAAMGKQQAQRVATEYAKLLDRYKRAKNKPVFEDTEGNVVTAESSRKIVEDYERKNPWLVDKADAIYEWWDTFMQEWAVGVSISQEKYDFLKEMYPHYVPTYRVNQSVGGANQTRGNDIRLRQAVGKAKGGTQAVQNLEDVFAMLVDRNVRLTRTNELYQNIIETLVLDDDGSFDDFGSFDWSSVRQGSSFVTSDGTTVTDQSLESDEQEELTQAGETAGLVKDSKHGTYRLSAWYNGTLQTAEISSELADALLHATKQTHESVADMLVKFGGWATGPMKTAITGINPAFGLRNVARDLPTAIINSISGLAFPKYWAQAWADMAAAGLVDAKILAMVSAKTGTDFSKLRGNAAHYERYKALGGGDSLYYNNESGFAKTLQKGDNIGAKALKAAGAMNEALETVTRFAEYLATIDKFGDTYEGRLRGMKNAAEVTVDFSRHGTVGRVINAWVPYWNPAVQGVDKVIRSLFQSRDGRTIAQQCRKTLGSAALLGIIPEAILYAVLKALKRDKDWEELTDRMKDTYYCIPTSDGNFLKIPKNREWGSILGTPFMRLLEGVDGRANPFENYWETSLKPNFLPPDITDAIVVSQIIDLASNKDFAGRSIVPYDLQSAKLEDQWNENTSWYARYARELGKLLHLSPIQADYILSTYFGDFADTLQKATSMATVEEFKTKDGFVAKVSYVGDAALELLSNPWKANSAYSNQNVSDYYEMLDELEATYTGIKAHEQTPGEYKASTEYQAYSAIKTLYGDRITELNRQAREAKTEDERIGYKREIAGLAKEALAYYDLCKNGTIAQPALDAKYQVYSGNVSNELIRMAEFSSANASTDFSYNFEPSPNPSKSYTDPKRTGYEYVLTDEQKEKFKEIYIEVYDRRMTELISSSRYQALPDEAGEGKSKAMWLEAEKAKVLTETKDEFFTWLRSSGVSSTPKVSKPKNQFK